MITNGVCIVRHGHEGEDLRRPAHADDLSVSIHHDDMRLTFDAVRRHGPAATMPDGYRTGYRL